MDSIKQTEFDSVTAVAKDSNQGLRRLQLPPTKVLLPVTALGVVVATVLWYLTTAVNPLVPLWRGLAGAAHLMSEAVVVPLWLVAVLGLTSLLSLSVTALRLGVALIAARRAGNPYRSDRIFDLDWQWRWEGDSPGVSSLTPLCPNCAYELSLETTPQTTSFESDDVGLVCESCAFSKHFEVGPSELLTRVVKEIRRRDRKDERA